MDLNVLIVPGDGIGTEVTREAVRVSGACLPQVRAQADTQQEALLGGIAIHKLDPRFRKRPQSSLSKPMRP